MDIELTSEQPTGTDPSISLPFPNAWWGRVVYALYITVPPALAFWSTDAFKPEWQSGKFSAYLVLFLFPEASLVFLLLLAYSVICYLFLLISPSRFSRFFGIRLGIYTGVLLALQYSILTLIYAFAGNAFGYVMILIWISPLIFSVVYRWAAAKWTAGTVNKFLLIFAVAALFIATVINRSASFFVLMVLTMAAPFWCFLIALRAALWLFKNYESGLTLPRDLGLIVWLATYAAAWRFDLLKMYELYAALPPQPPPDCYIATAAARGHPRFVQAWTVQRTDGTALQVNRQLQRLKCAELALMKVNPRLHGVLRQIYDLLGKWLACRIQNPFLADVAYLLLKPWEWTVELALRMIVPEIDAISKKMYVN